MTTVVSTGKQQPAVDLNLIHWEVFTFKQKKDQNPIRAVDGAFTHYGFNGEERIYDKESIGVSDPNMDETVVNNHIANDGTLESFGLDYYNEKQAVTTEYLAGNISDAKLMAYFELAMARVAELNGKLTISSVE